jgi:hypothetical protein
MMADKDKLWQDVKKGFKDTVTYVSEKTEELTTMGKLKIDIAGLNRKKDKKFNDLGKLVHSKLQAEEGLVLDSDDEVKAILEEIDNLNKELEEKEKELEEVGKKEEEEKAEAVQEAEVSEEAPKEEKSDK